MGQRLSGTGLVVMLAVAAGGIGPADASSAEGLAGLWLTQDGDARIRIEPCGDELCGRIVWMSDPLDGTGAALRDVENPDKALRARPVQGLTILRIDDTPDEKGSHRGGRIYDPKSGRTYRCTMRRDGDSTLRMRGYLGIALIGRTTRWTRLPEDEEAPGAPRLSDNR